MSNNNNSNLASVSFDSSDFGPPEISPEELTYEEKIGGGCFGNVYKGKCRGVEVAIKKLFKQDLNEKAITEFKREVEFCSRLHHPNVLLFMGACTVPGELALVMELMPKGNLESLLHDNKVKLSLFKRMKFAREIAQGMNWLHRSKPPIIHRDLKPSNVLVDKHGICKVCDFGLSAVKPNTGKLKDRDSIPGTPLWMGPEVMMGKPLDEKADVYSYAILLWEIVTQQIPFPEMNSFPVFKRAICIQNVRPPINDISNENIKNLLTDCWDRNPAARPGFDQIIDMLNIITVESAILDAAGVVFWKNNFIGKNVVSFAEFAESFYEFLAIDMPEDEEEDHKYQCLKYLVSSKNPDNTIIDGGNIVTIEKFGALLNFFGPIEGGDKDILTRIMRTCKQPWFHGDISKKQAENLLRSYKEGYYLIRLSETMSGTFTISKVTPKKTINHQRIIYQPQVGYTIKIQTEDGEKLFRSQPNKSLRSFMKSLEGDLFLTNPCPGSKYKALIFQRRRINTSDIEGYLDDDSNI
eukprot:TRINITY_DN97_c0_g1_i1.p1 TRINITY_DN97_c0_g1~~TRINITY_DN97_c0_g1_i1.p1  ORF type:complete len:523 (+),score=211.21 TRINITY_DN97_c0_g1_i1:57-1625(+)